MRLVTTGAEVRHAVRELRSQGRSIALVPTMGALHPGHLALVDAAAADGAAVVVTIFVNPLQFGPAEDLARYPRDLDRDRELLARRAATVLFAPALEAIYPETPMVTVDPGTLGGQWEGAVRPGHFAGVLTVVAKLLHLVGPDRLWLGQKDIQQVTLIRRMARDLDWPVVVETVPTVREADGLAMSSRNAYLSPDDRRRAVVLSRALAAAQRAWRAGCDDPGRLEAEARRVFAAEPAVRVDYIAVVDPDRMAPIAEAAATTIIAVAARVGSTRLIDNLSLGAR